MAAPWAGQSFESLFTALLVGAVIYVLVGRHIAKAGVSGEVSGHYHPKATLQTRACTISRPAFLIDSDRLILPAYGTYTGGLRSRDATLARLMRSDASAILTGPMSVQVPMPR